MVNYLQVGTAYYGDAAVDTIPIATGKKGWRRYDTNGNVFISDGTDWDSVGGSGTITSLDDIPGVDLTTLNNGDVLTYTTSGTKWVATQPPGATAGEANTLTNVGSGAQVAKSKVGVNYDVRTFVAASGGKLTVTQNADDITFQVVDASTTQKGAVELATDGENASGVVVQGNDSRLSDDRTPTAHAHSGADITSGTISSGQLPDATTSAKGAVELATNGENASGVVVQGNDSRLSDARNPVTHSHAATDIVSGTIDNARITDASTTTKGIVELSTSSETTAGLAVQASDTRLSDARTPVAHVHSGADITSGTVPIAQLPDASETAKGIAELATSAETAAGLVVQASDTRLSNSRTPTAHVTTHRAGGTDPFTKDDDLNAAARYIEDTADPTSDAQRIWLEDATANLKYWSDESTPVKHTVERQANKGAANGYASLDGSTLVPPAQLPSSTTSAKGAVILATDGGVTAATVVQANDARLSNSRTPTAHVHSGADITSGSISTSVIGDASITTAKLAASLVGINSKIPDDEFTWAKINKTGATVTIKETLGYGFTGNVVRTASSIKLNGDVTANGQGYFGHTLGYAFTVKRVRIIPSNNAKTGTTTVRLYRNSTQVNSWDMAAGSTTEIDTGAVTYAYTSSEEIDVVYDSSAGGAAVSITFAVYVDIEKTVNLT